MIEKKTVGRFRNRPPVSQEENHTPQTNRCDENELGPAPSTCEPETMILSVNRSTGVVQNITIVTKSSAPQSRRGVKIENE